MNEVETVSTIGNAFCDVNEFFSESACALNYERLKSGIIDISF